LPPEPTPATGAVPLPRSSFTWSSPDHGCCGFGPCASGLKGKRVGCRTGRRRTSICGAEEERTGDMAHLAMPCQCFAFCSPCQALFRLQFAPGARLKLVGSKSLPGERSVGTGRDAGSIAGRAKRCPYTDGHEPGFTRGCCPAQPARTCTGLPSLWPPILVLTAESPAQPAWTALVIRPPWFSVTSCVRLN
jgi:hypothetical protein